MSYDPHTISLEAEISTLAEHRYEDVGAQEIILGSVALVGSLAYQSSDDTSGAPRPGTYVRLER